MNLRAALIGVVLPSTALLFHRGIGDSFDLTKATVLWFISLLIGSLVVAQRPLKIANRTLIAIGVLTLTILFTSVFSERPMQSVFGQYQRNTGALTLVACCVIFLAVASRPDLRVLKVAGWSLVLAAVGVSVYTILQVSGADPWEWVTPGQDRAVFGTLGNSNTSGGFVACTVPLALALGHRSDRKAWRLLFGTCAVFMACAVGVLGAFQGVVASVIGAAGVSLAVLLSQARNSETIGTLGLASLTVLAVFWVDSGLKTLVVVSISLVFSLVPVITEVEENAGLLSWLRATKSRLVSATACVAVGVAALVGLLGGEVSRQVSEGLRERRYFFSAAFQMLLDRPLLGSGLETYGLYFTRERPLAHALAYENNRSSSAHSIPLGMFANGGVLLGLAYLFFIGFVAHLIFSRRAKLRDNWLAIGLVIAWISTQVQSLVSVEHVALFTQQFVLAGAVVAVLTTDDFVGKMSRARRLHTSRSGGSAVVFSVGVVISGLLMVPLSRPIRADNHGLWSLRYAASGDPVSSLEFARRAADLAPWSSQQRVRLAQALYDVKDSSYAVVADDVAGQLDYTPPYAIEAAYRVAESGDFERGSDIAELALSRDPHSVSLRNQVADLFLQMGQIYAARGDIALARANLERVIDLAPSPSISATAEGVLNSLEG